MRRRIRERDPGRIAARADHGGRSLLAATRAELAPGADALRAPSSQLFHDLGAIERMQVEQNVRKLGRRQDVALDAASRADEERLDVGSQLHERSRDREPRIEMAARAAAGEEDARSAMRSTCRIATVKPEPRADRSRRCRPLARCVLPMFTRMPVKSIVSTRFERPYETNGSVSPVVGSSPMTTPMCRYAVSTVMNVSPTATSCRNGDRALRAMRNPSSA